MDNTLIRLILLAAGILLLIVIYIWESNRRKKMSSQAKTREPELSEIPQLDAEQEPTGWNLNQEDPDNLDSELAHLIAEMQEETDHQEAVSSLQDETGSSALEATVEQQEEFAFSAKEESPVDVPAKIIQINIKAKNGQFTGPAILEAVRETGLQAGEMQIYHRYTGDGSHKVVFNMASMVEPGVFPLKAMQTFTTPGLTLFAQLPGPGDSLSIFSDMLYTAERLAVLLGGALQDESHSTLTKQTIENIRSQIMEHRRLVQLARSRR